MNPKPSKASLVAMDHLFRSVHVKDLMPKAHLRLITSQSQHF